MLHDGLWFTDDWRRFEVVGIISGSEVVKLTRFWRGRDVFLVGGGDGSDVAMSMGGGSARWNCWREIFVAGLGCKYDLVWPRVDLCRLLPVAC